MNKKDKQVWEKLQKVDMLKVLKKLCLPSEKGGYNWPKEEAKKIIEVYRKFLLEGYQHNGDLELKHAKTPQKENIPGTLIDIVWHTNILFTRDYMKMCNDIFGFYFHHEHSGIEDIPW